MNANVIQGRIRCRNHGQGPPQVPAFGWIRSQYPAFGSSFHLKPMVYWRISAIQNAGVLTPTRTKTIPPRSSNDRGRSADMIPIGSASSIQKTAPPATIEAGAGAGAVIVCVTSWRVGKERPREWGPLERLGENA